MGSQGVVQGSSRQKGNGGERPRGKNGVDSKENKSNPEKLQNGDKPLFNSVDQHPLHVHDIFAYSGEKIPARPMVVPRGGETLESKVEVPSKIQDDLLLKKIVEEDSQGVESVAPKKNQKQKPNQPRKAIRLALGNNIVDQDSRKPGINQAKQS